MTEFQSCDASLGVLVTGATGYIGGRLAPRLVEAGHRVRALARDPDKISDVPWAADVEVVRGDLTEPDSLDDACRDIDVVYYLVHSMGNPGEFIDSGAGWTDSPGASVWLVAAATLTSCTPATPWTSGGSNESNDRTC